MGMEGRQRLLSTVLLSLLVSAVSIAGLIEERSLFLRLGFLALLALTVVSDVLVFMIHRRQVRVRDPREAETSGKAQ
jgi:hypothetical protein